MDDSKFLFLDGNPAWLDYVNTRYIRDGEPFDAMPAWPDLLAWLKKAGLLDAAGVRAWSDSAQAPEALKAALKLRDELHAAAARLSTNGSVPASAVSLVNELLEAAPGMHRLVPVETGFRLDYEAAPGKAIHLLEPLVRSAADFLARAELDRVRKCGNDKCVLFFYDATRNRARRWCAMAWCGNRMKAAAHYRRLRE